MKSLPEALPLRELFLWGRITRAHGLRGHVLAESFSENPTAYDLRTFWIVQGEVGYPRKVAFIRPYSSQKNDSKPHRWWRLRFTDTEDRTEAEKLRGIELYLPRAYLPPLEAGQFYYIEAQNARVVDEQGTLRGYLKDIQPGLAYDFFIVEGEEGATFWIPAPFVRHLDRSTSPPTLIVEGPEGIWDPSLARGLP